MFNNACSNIVTINQNEIGSEDFGQNIQEPKSSQNNQNFMQMMSQKMTVEPNQGSDLPQLNLVSPIPVEAFNQLAAGVPFEINAILYDGEQQQNKSRSPSYVQARLGPIGTTMGSNEIHQQASVTAPQIPQLTHQNVVTQTASVQQPYTQAP